MNRKPEVCAVCDQFCKQPAGIGIPGYGYAETPPKYVLPLCVECGEPVCGNCSLKRKHGRVCHSCAGDDAALKHLTRIANAS